MARPTLDDIFAEDDTLNLLKVKIPIKKSPVNSQFIKDFEEIRCFVSNQGRLPDMEASAPEERKFARILNRLRELQPPEVIALDAEGLLNPQRAKVQVPHLIDWQKDEVPEELIPDSLDDIFGDELLGEAEVLDTHTYTTPATERHETDYQGKLRPCKDFEAFQPTFDKAMQDIADGTVKVLRLQERQTIHAAEGDFFVRNGLLALIAETSEPFYSGNQRDYRLRVIFSNGTESDLLMSSWRKSLSDDGTARIITRNDLGLLTPPEERDLNFVTGTIYVVRTLSNDPALVPFKSKLLKIGVTSQEVKRRLANAQHDPTFLLAPVELVATYTLKNLARQKIERLLHDFFHVARPKQLSIRDRFGKRVEPREWFLVQPEHVSQAAKLIQDKTLYKYRFDVVNQQIVKRPEFENEET